MTSDDYEQFVALLQRYSGVFRKELDDDQIRVYWNALKDRPLADIERRAELYAKKGKFYPNPADLRPKESNTEPFEETDEGRRRFDQLNRESAAEWDQRLAKDPLKTKLELCKALEARYSVEKDQGNPMLAHKREWLHGRRRELIEEAINANRPELVLADLNLWSDLLGSEDGYKLIDRLEALCVQTGVQCRTPFMGRSHFYPIPDQVKKDSP